MNGLTPPASEWERYLDAFEQSVATAEATGVVPNVDLKRDLGPIPVNLANRAQALADRIEKLHADMSAQMEEISGELSQVTHSSRGTRQPPPARHLNQLA